jgi:hypothetical protein
VAGGTSTRTVEASRVLGKILGGSKAAKPGSQRFNKLLTAGATTLVLGGERTLDGTATKASPRPTGTSDLGAVIGSAAMRQRKYVGQEGLARLWVLAPPGNASIFPPSIVPLQRCVRYWCALGRWPGWHRRGSASDVSLREKPRHAGRPPDKFLMRSSSGTAFTCTLPGQLQMQKTAVFRCRLQSF